MNRSIFNTLILCGICSISLSADDAPSPPKRPVPRGTVKLNLRTRVETFKGSGAWDQAIVTREVPVAEVAIIICDMWDKHWCEGATARCDALAEKMAPVIKTARAKGIQIIHAPSETMNFYQNTVQRRRMMLAPLVELPKPLEIPDMPLPIDDSDGGCDSGQKPWHKAWTRQNGKIDIGEFDGISDNGDEVYRFLRQQGIKYLIVMGVHTNMCVLNRTFAIRQMTRRGIHCMLARDLTDTMYNPQMRPYVSHDQGTALVIEHIEKYWCPSLSSGDLVAGLP